MSCIRQRSPGVRRTVHTPSPLPNFSFGPTATATLQPSVNNNELYVAITGCPIPTLSFSWGGIPSWISWLLIPLLDSLATVLNEILGPLIGTALSLPPIHVCTMPGISFTLAGTPIHIRLQQATTAAGGSPQSSLLMVNAQIEVS